MKKFAFFLLLIPIIVTVLVAVLARPDRLGEIEFWIIVVWFLFLIMLNWYFSFYLFVHGTKHDTKVHGAIPALNILVALYTIVSAFLLIISWYVTDFIGLPNWHLISQVIVGGVTAFVIVLIFISVKAQESDLIVGDIRRKEELVRQLKTIISTLPTEKRNLESELIVLRDYIQYSMPHENKLTNFENYELLNLKIDEFLVTLNEEVDGSSKIDTMLILAKTC